MDVVIDELLGGDLTLGGIGMQQIRDRLAMQDSAEFPSQIKGVLHRYVHPLTGLCRVGMTGVPGNENPRLAVAPLVIRNIVETIGNALPDLVDRPPRYISDLKTVGANDLVSCRNDVSDRDAFAECIIAVGNTAEI